MLKISNESAASLQAREQSEREFIAEQVEAMIKSINWTLLLKNVHSFEELIKINPFNNDILYGIYKKILLANRRSVSLFIQDVWLEWEDDPNKEIKFE